MKAHPTLLLTLICQSLCAQQVWVWTGANEMRSYDKTDTNELVWWKKQILDPESLSEVYLTKIPTPEYDKMLQISRWYGGKQTWVGSNRTSITWSNDFITTNVIAWSSNGRWDTGGNCTSWQGRDINGNPYDLQSWANMAVYWKTNSDFTWRCADHTDRLYVLGLYRTNGTSSMGALCDTTATPGHTNYLIAPETSGKYDFKFMLTQGCSHCGEGCPMAWTLIPMAHSPRAILMAQNNSVQILIPTEGQEERYSVEGSDDGLSHWMELETGPIPLQQRIQGGLIKMEDRLPTSGSRFYRVKYSRATVDDVVSEMFHAR